MLNRTLFDLSILVNKVAASQRRFDSGDAKDAVAILDRAETLDLLTIQDYPEWEQVKHEITKASGEHGLDAGKWLQRHLLSRLHTCPAQMPEPLMVKVQPSNKRPGSMVAFIGKQLCFFENDDPTPTSGELVEVMITRVLYGSKDIQPGEMGNSFAGASEPIKVRDYGRIVGVLIRVVDHSKYVLSKTNGFSCSGSMCSTTASGRIEGRDDTKSVAFHTPGRTDVWVAENNSEDFERWPYTPRRPCWIWVKRGDTRKAEGLTRFEDASYAHLVRK